MHAPHPRAAPHLRYVDAIVLIACVAGAFIAARALGQDANWDLQNYHFYNPWAWITGRIFDWDIAAAQLQTFHNPLPDVPFYALVAAGVHPRLITLWLALPTGIAAYFAIRIAWLLFADLALMSRLGATVAAITIGFTGTMGVGQLGSTTDEWLVSAFVIASLWLLVQAEPSPPGAQFPLPRLRTFPVVLAGVLIGVASGLKLTAATYAVGLAVALLGRRAPLAAGIRNATWFSVAVVVGLALTLGPWSYALYTHYGNPLFPYGNQWFHSPWWDFRPALPARYGPHSFREWVVLPFKLLAPDPGFVSEIRYVDARMPLLYGVALTVIASLIAARFRQADDGVPASFRTTSPRWRMVSIAFGTSFVVWAVLHSILRYTVPLEILSGVLIVGAIGRLMSTTQAAIAVTCAMFALVSTTVWSEWGRVPFGRTWFDVQVPPVEPKALVLLTVDAPMSYVLPFFPPDARHVGIRNNVIDPASRNRLAERIAGVVREHDGPVYALSFPKGQGNEDLQAHGLRRVEGRCADVRTNMPTSPIELCRLERIGAGAK